VELDQLYRDAPIGFAHLDRRLRFVRINQRLAESNGKSVAAHIGRPLRKMFPGIASKVAPILRRVIKSGKPALSADIQASTEAKRGVKKFWLASYYPFKSEAGKVLGVQAFILNVGGRKELEPPGESEALSRVILNSLRDQIAVLDSQGRIIAANEAWQRFASQNGAISSLVGVKPGINYLKVCRRAAKKSSEGAREALGGIRSVFSGTRDHFNLDYLWHSPSEQRWFRMSVTPLTEAARGVVIAHSDITRHKTAEQEREELLGFETLLAELSARFVHLPADKVDKNIEGSLKRISEYLNVERSTLFELSADKAKLYRTHSYAVRGVRKTLPTLSEEQLPWWFGKLRRGEKVVLHSIPDDLPKEAMAERQWFAKNFVKSHLAIPLVVDRSMVGVLTFRSSARQWSKDLIQRLELVGQVFANALERKRIHEKLTENEQRLRLLVETTKVIPWEMDAETWEFAYLGPQVVGILGYPLKQWYEKNFWASHIHPEDRESIIELCLSCTARGQDHELEYRMVASDGSLVWFHDLVTVESVDGRPKIRRGVMVEITGRKLTEQALHERVRFETLVSDLSTKFVNLPASEVQSQIEFGLRSIVEFMDLDVAALIQPLGDTGQLGVSYHYTAPGFQVPRRYDISQFAWYMAQLRRGEPVVLPILPDDLPQEAVREREAALQLGLKSSVTIPIHIGGSVLGGMSLSSYRAPRPWPDELIQRLNLLGEIFGNALERTKSFEALRKTEEHLRLLLETTNVLPWQASPTPRNFTYVGPQAKKLLGYPIEDWYQNDFWAAHIHPEDREPVVDFCLRSSPADYALDYRMISADGKVVWIHDVVSVDHEDGLPKTLRGFMIDITRQKVDEENLNAYRQALRTLASELSLSQEKERRQIADDLHDQLGQNLVLAKVKLGELRESLPLEHAPLADEIRHLVDQTIKDTRSLIHNLCPQVLYEFGLEAAIDWLVEQVQVKYGLRCVVEKIQQLKPLSDKIQLVLFQAVRELLTNVAKHARANQARIILEGEEDCVKIKVVDDGCGFDPSSLLLPGTSGGGFGLFSLRERLAAIGGTLDIDSSAGNGMRVTVTAALEP
jgi:PAS domain S-box-containing protein